MGRSLQHPGCRGGRGALAGRTCIFLIQLTHWRVRQQRSSVSVCACGCWGVLVECATHYRLLLLQWSERSSVARAHAGVAARCAGAAAVEHAHCQGLRM